MTDNEQLRGDCKNVYFYIYIDVHITSFRKKFLFRLKNVCMSTSF